MENKPKLRITQFIDFKKISKRAFSSTIDVSHNFFSNESAIGSDVLEKIFSIYPELNMDWVITGRGEMIYSSNQNLQNMKERLNYGAFLKIIMDKHDLTNEHLISTGLITSERLEEALSFQGKIDIQPLFIIEKITGVNYYQYLAYKKANNTEQQFEIIEYIENIIESNGKLPVIETTWPSEKNLIQILKEASDALEHLKNKD